MVVNSIITAFRTLTIIPLPGKYTRQCHQSMLFFCIVGIALGFLHLAVYQAFSSLTNILPLIGLILSALNYMLTGALHLDGMADTADAFGIRRERQRTLDILKDSHLGTFGVTAIVFIVLWRVIVYQSLVEHERFLVIIPCMALSRTVQGILLSILPYARDNTGKAFAFSGKPVYGIFLFLELIVLQTIFYLYSGSVLSILPTLVGLLFTVPVALIYLQRIQGITGDGIGASNEVFELTFLTAAMVI